MPGEVAKADTGSDLVASAVISGNRNFSHLAGRRRSLLLALLAGGCAWASLHQYYAARVALPLGALALLAGLAPVPTRKLRAAAVVAVYVAAMLGLQLTAHRSEPWQGLWPSYQGYVGTSGEKSVGELVQSAVATLREQAPATARAYFWERRTAPVRYEAGIWAPVPSGSALSLAPTSGGLCLLPVALLALVGCICSLRHPRREKRVIIKNILT